MDNPILGQREEQGETPESPITAPAKPHPFLSALDQEHSQLRSLFDKTAKAQSHFEVMKNNFNDLLSMGDSVTADDVMEHLGKTVGAGISPEPLIAMIAGNPQGGQSAMPESGDGLNGWLKGHFDQFSLQDQQLAKLHQTVAQKLGTVGLQSLMVHHIEQTKKDMDAAAAKRAKTGPDHLFLMANDLDKPQGGLH